MTSIYAFAEDLAAAPNPNLPTPAGESAFV
jgi:hypothetical protein